MSDLPPPVDDALPPHAYSSGVEVHPAAANGAYRDSAAYPAEKEHHGAIALDDQGIHHVDTEAIISGDYADASGYEKGESMHDGVLRGEKRGANVVVLGGMDPHSKDGMVHRRLKTRHISMIAIGGCIGTGLFVGSGESYNTAGPLGILLGYAIMGFFVWTMMIALGEMVTLFPISGAFVHYASRFVDPAFGFAMGYNYAYSYAITLPTEVVAAAIVISYWNTSINVAVWITIFLVAAYVVNLAGVRYYGEAEFWFSLIKVITIVGLIILSICISAGGDPSGESIGFRYWRNPGPFQQLDGIGGAKGRFLAFWAVFVQAAFSFIGTEIVALTAGEAANPRKNMPRAIRRVFFRIIAFYVLGVMAIGITVDPNDPRLLSGAGNASASPFVIAIDNAGINSLPSIVNAVLLIAAWSAGNSDLYASSRTLYGLAISGQTPRFMRYCTKQGLPIWCLIACSLLGPLAYLNVSSTGVTVFNWFYNISAITGLITWWGILLTYIRFYHGLKYHGIDRNEFPYKAPFQPYLSYVGCIFFFIVTIFNGFQVFLNGNSTGGFNGSNFVAAYVSLPIFAGFYLFWKIFKRTGFVRLQGRREIDQMDEEEREKAQLPSWYNTWYGKIWGWIV